MRSGSGKRVQVVSHVEVKQSGYKERVKHVTGNRKTNRGWYEKMEEMTSR